MRDSAVAIQREKRPHAARHADGRGAVPVNRPAGCADAAVKRPRPPARVPVTRQAQTEDDLLAFLLIHTWTLVTGRILRSDVPPTQLSEDELIAFWADDHIAPPDSQASAHRADGAGR